MEDSAVKREREETRTSVTAFSPSMVGMTLAELTLSPDVTDSVKEEFKDFSIMFCNLSCLSNMLRHERLELITAYKMVAILLEWGDIQTARSIMGEVLMSLNLMRSVDHKGLDSLQSLSTRVVEHMPDENKPVYEGRKGLISRIAASLKGGT